MPDSTTCNGNGSTHTSSGTDFASQGLTRLCRSAALMESCAAQHTRTASQSGSDTTAGKRKAPPTPRRAERSARLAERKQTGHNAQQRVLPTGHCLATACDLRPSSFGSTPRHEPRYDHSFDEILSSFLTARSRPPVISTPAAIQLLDCASCDKNIIGRSVGRFRLRVLPLGGAPLVLLHQPARQHGRRILLDPGVQQLPDFLAQIGRMAQPREFVALQGCTRSRKQKLPRRLSPTAVQGALQGSEGHGSTAVNSVNGTRGATRCGKVWKFCWSGF